MLRIAVDARPLAHPQTGIGRYTEQLLKRLVNSGHQWFLYSDRAISPHFPIDDHVQLRYGDTRPGGPLSLFYSQLVFPRWARGDCVDLFWSPRHHLPLWLPASVTSVVTIHDLVWKRYPETMLGRNLWVERRLAPSALRKADRIIAVSEFTASEIAHFFPAYDARCVVIPEAADRPLAHYENAYPELSQPYLLFVGTPEPRKNLERLILAYAQAREQGLQHQLIVVGAQGWGQHDAREQVENLGLLDHVIFRGRVSDAELQHLYGEADALLMPSLYEGFGLPVLEAMHHGVPSLISAGSALPEVAGDSGLQVNPQSVQSISEGLIKITGDRELHGIMSQCAQERVAEFSWDQAAERTLELLMQAGQTHEC